MNVGDCVCFLPEWSGVWRVKEANDPFFLLSRPGTKVVSLALGYQIQPATEMQINKAIYRDLQKLKARRVVVPIRKAKNHAY